MKRKERRVTTPEEEGIELFPDAMERTERAIKAAFGQKPVPRAAIKDARRRPSIKPRSVVQKRER
jgi:hypothetical protein